MPHTKLFADKIARYGLRSPKWCEGVDAYFDGDLTLNTEQMVHEAPKILATNVCEYFWSVHQKDPVGDDPMKYFPCVTLPFPMVWVEMRVPKSIYALPGRVLTIENGPAEAGVLFASHTMAEFMSDDQFVKFRRDELSFDRSSHAFITWQAVWQRVDRISPVLSGAFTISEHGAMTGHPCAWATVPPDSIDARMEYEEWSIHMTRLALWPALMTLSFMNCVDVERRTVVPPVSLSKSCKAKLGRSPYSYKVLDILRAQRMLSDEGGIARNGLKMALHICRGHFKNLTAERYKNRGLRWWRPHTRGNKDLGVMEKSYAL